jgi:hypothetical protein
VGFADISGIWDLRELALRTPSLSDGKEVGMEATQEKDNGK